MVEIQYESGLNVLGLGTLAAKDAVNVDTNIDASRLQGFRVASINIAAVVSGKTASEGPIMWGLSCNMTAAEVESSIEADPQDSTVETDHGKGQWLKIMGLIPLASTSGSLTGDGSNVAKPDHLKINWSVIEGKNMSVWAYNLDSSPLTTGTLITYVMEIFGVWLRD